MDELLQFLKKYSDIDSQFIKEFIQIQHDDNLHEPFKIDLDLIAKWLDTRKDDLKDTLVKRYKEKVDYILLRVHPERKRGGGNKETILLTSDCFKMLCMRSTTKNAEKIRYYYLTLEKLVNIYKDEIIYNQEKKINELQYNLKKKVFPVKGAIYVIKINDGYKIGKTENLTKRFKIYKNAHKNDPVIEYVFYSHDIDKLESCIKNILRSEEYINRKEYYVLELVDIINAIIDCDNLISHFKCKSCKLNGTINKFKSHIDKHKFNEKIKFYGKKINKKYNK